MATITTKPGQMKHKPPTRAPAAPRSRHAQKMANCVDAGPGNRLVTAMPSSNSPGSNHWRCSTHSRRNMAT